tara:strand:+ start:3403 stop:4155 length:753 start_codon:yes stop_codon:yes gene_type:complete
MSLVEQCKISPDFRKRYLKELDRRMQGMDAGRYTSTLHYDQYKSPREILAETQHAASIFRSVDPASLLGERILMFGEGKDQQNRIVEVTEVLKRKGRATQFLVNTGSDTMKVSLSKGPLRPGSGVTFIGVSSSTPLGPYEVNFSSGGVGYKLERTILNVEEVQDRTRSYEQLLELDKVRPPGYNDGAPDQRRPLPPLPPSPAAPPRPLPELPLQHGLKPWRIETSKTFGALVGQQEALYAAFGRAPEINF